MQRTIRAVVFAALVTFGMAGTALADTINETLTILSAVSCSGIPASVNYGNVTPGTPSAPQSFGVSCTGNVAWALKLTSASSFSGPGTLTATARQIRVDSLNLATTAFGSYTASDAAVGGNVLAGGPGTGSGTVNLRIDAPASTLAGPYTGNIVLTVQAQ